MRTEDRTTTETVAPAADAGTGNLDLSIPDGLIDGLMLTEAVLAVGMDALVLPRQVLLAGPRGGDVGRVSFVHGLPQACTLSGVTYAQDKRVRRALLQRANLRVPQGATFSYRGLGDAEHFAERVGYPLELTEAVGENPSERIGGILNKEALLEAVERLRRLPGERSSTASSLTRSAYALTGLLDMAEDEEGRKLAAQATRFLLERESPGDRLRFLVLGASVIAVLQVRSRPPSGHGDAQPPEYRVARLLPARGRLFRRDRSDDVHPGYAELALKAVRSIPGMALATVDIVCSDKGLAPEDTRPLIADLSERPRLEVFSRARAGLGEQLAMEVLRFEAARVSTRVAEAVEHVSLRLGVEAVPDIGRFVELASQAIAALGLEGQARTTDEIDGTATICVAGPPRGCAVLVEAIMGGGLGGLRAVVLDVRQAGRDQAGT